MSRYRIEVIEQVTYCVTIDAETAQEALEAVQRHEGESIQASAPKWIFGKPKRLEIHSEFSDALETKKTAKK